MVGLALAPWTRGRCGASANGRDNAVTGKGDGTLRVGGRALYVLTLALRRSPAEPKMRKGPTRQDHSVMCLSDQRTGKEEGTPSGAAINGAQR